MISNGYGLGEYVLYIFLVFLTFYLFLRAGEGQREKRTEDPKWALCGEPDTGLELMNGEFMT